MIFYTSDTHFGHVNILRFCNRPFQDIREHDEALIANWNAVVPPEATVIHAGDFAFGNQQKTVPEFVRRLNGKIILVLGNHDKEKVIRKLNCFEAIHHDLELMDSGHKVVVHHYGKRVWNKSHWGSYHFYGHSHGTLPPQGRSIDIGVDVWNFKPVTFGEIQAKLENLQAST